MSWDEMKMEEFEWKVPKERAFLQLCCNYEQSHRFLSSRVDFFAVWRRFMWCG